MICQYLINSQSMKLSQKISNEYCCDENRHDRKKKKINA